MMRRPEDVKQRISNIQQIEDIIVAMRGLAAAHSHDAQKHLAAIKTHEATVAEAIAHVLAHTSAPEPSSDVRSRPLNHLKIVIGAEQGFSGTYNEHIVETALNGAEGADRYDYMVIGQRAIAEFDILGKEPAWTSNMVSRVSDAPSLASRMVDALFRQIEGSGAQLVSLVAARPGSPSYTVENINLMPFDFSRFSPPDKTHLPMLTTSPKELLEGLIEEYIFTEICEALILGFAAENDARMKAMTRARSNVEHINNDLQLEYNQSRQEQTTTEIIELSASSF